MYNKIIISLQILIACFTATISFCQQLKKEIKPDQYRAINWTRLDGLPNVGTHVMFKDAKGFLWIGNAYGSELCRFDGSNFKKYLPGKEKRGTINSDRILSFKEDSLHNIWMGTGMGLSKYDIKADTFTNFSPYNSSISTLLTMAPFWATKDEMFCIEPGGVITAFNIYTLKRRILVQVSKKFEIGISWNTNKSFFEKSSNSIWTLSRDAEGYGKLQQIFLAGGTEYYTWPCYNKTKHLHTVESQPRHDAEDFHYDPKRNSIWINSGEGLLEFTLNDKQFHRIAAFNEFIKLEDYDRGVGIDLDIYGRVWLSTFFNGIFIYDPQTEQARQVFSDTSLQQKTGQDNLHIYCDRDGIIWTSNWTNHGIYELLPFNTPFKRYVANTNMQHSLSNNKILSIVPASGGRMWIGTEDGLNIFDPDTETFEVLRVKDLQGIKGNSIVPIHIDTIHQKAWFTTNSSFSSAFYAKDVYEMDIKTRRCRPMVFRDGAKLLDTLQFVPGWCKPYKNGFLLLDDFHGVFEIKSDSPFADLIIPLKATISHSLLKQNRFLFLKNWNQQEVFPLNFTFENKNGKWARIPHLLDSLHWRHMLYSEKDQTYWICFKNELVHYDKDFRKLESYSEQDGYYGGDIINMLTDNEGNIWFNNDLSQVNRLNTTTGIIKTLSEADGYQKQNFDWSSPAAKDGQGNLYFGIGWKTGTAELNWGLDRIYPERYSSGNIALVYLNSIAINQKPFALPVVANSLEYLPLDHKQNTIRIETGIIDFYSKVKGHIRYKLEGIERTGDWQYPPDHIVRLEGLPPGNYRLAMQASNAGNEFNGPEKILTIYISPPFWETWWFRILSIIAMIIVVYAIVQERSRNLKKQNIQLEEKVLARTKELKHSLEELRATQNQLIHSEKMASLGELTAGIAHEIQNPLNFVNNFSEVNKELLSEMKDELNKGNINEANTIADDVIDNEEKINHHGKRAGDIVKGMLQHSRSSTGVKEPTDINALADEYLRLSYHGLRAKDKNFNAAMKTDFDKTIGNIKIIPQDIGRVLLNLYNNAFYAVNEQKKNAGENYQPTVTVQTKKLNDKVEIIVSDNGNGIPQKIVGKIFQPFFTTKPTGQGTGLGLSLSYDIVKAHGGELRVKSKEGDGSVFLIILPFKG